MNWAIALDNLHSIVDTLRHLFWQTWSRFRRNSNSEWNEHIENLSDFDMTVYAYACLYQQHK